MHPGVRGQLEGVTRISLPCKPWRWSFYPFNHLTGLWAFLLRMVGVCQRVALEGTSVQLLFTRWGASFCLHMCDSKRHLWGSVLTVCEWLQSPRVAHEWLPSKEPQSRQHRSLSVSSQAPWTPRLALWGKWSSSIFLYTPTPSTLVLLIKRKFYLVPFPSLNRISQTWHSIKSRVQRSVWFKHEGNFVKSASATEKIASHQ